MVFSIKLFDDDDDDSYFVLGQVLPPETAAGLCLLTHNSAVTAIV